MRGASGGPEVEAAGDGDIAGRDVGMDLGVGVLDEEKGQPLRSTTTSYIQSESLNMFFFFLKHKYSIISFKFKLVLYFNILVTFYHRTTQPLTCVVRARP
jgi:hypothetical protein